ncbi:hypothetical protein FKM82_027278 [Ascaphus truei]
MEIFTGARERSGRGALYSNTSDMRKHLLTVISAGKPAERSQGLNPARSYLRSVSVSARFLFAVVVSGAGYIVHYTWHLSVPPPMPKV